jgi:outer membrane protein OmpA-like peptidoglycan-associated protein
MDLQLFRPPAGQGATFSIDRTQVPRHLSLSFGLDASYAHGLLTRTSDGTGVVPWRAQAELLVALGLFQRIELGLALPLTVVRYASDPFGGSADTSRVRPADMRLSVKAPLLRGDFRLTARLVLSLPTGSARFAAARYWTSDPSLLASYELGSLTLAGELGYLLRKRSALADGTGNGELELDDELHVSVGARYEIIPSVAAIAEVTSRMGFPGRGARSNEFPMDGNLGVRLTAAPGFTIDVGGGTSLISGYGAPDGRAFVIVRYATEHEPCEAGPEDFDGYLDGDFCADPDNDGDGLLDDEDECPNDAEDRDGFLDQDGCPDSDNDADGILDGPDQCPMRSEDLDGYQDTDGCPEPDNDEDGILDGVDHCPMEPEDRDHYEDDDGCPEPGPAQAVVTVTDTRILISERVYFEFDRDTIRSVSLPLLDQVASVFADLPSDRVVRVEGYTDSEGVHGYNVDLSYRRARAVVEYLTSKGVPRARLDYVGYGDRNPVAPNDSPEGRALNRRVEFTIIEPGDRRRAPSR